MSSVSPHCVRVTDPLLLEPDDVREWFRNQLRAGISFHPDTPANDVITFTESEARGNEVMYLGKPHPTERRWFLWNEAQTTRLDDVWCRAFTICHDYGEDIYGLSCEVFEEHEFSKMRGAVA